VQYPLQQCDSGYVVLLVQQALREAGEQDVPIDGNFDQATHDAVRAYQERAGLTVDGLVGSETWTSLVPDPPGEDLNNNGIVDPFEVTPG
jgi:peptidoglycan hydrolase-like protein with peptidoglycan-binding domain